MGEPAIIASALRVYPIRLKPGDDLVESLVSFVSRAGMSSAFIMTCCGSIEGATIRFAEKGDGKLGQQEVKRFDEHFEICSLVGTISSGGKQGHHLHCVLGRKDGTSISGHLCSGPTPIFSTAEIVLGECSSVEFGREHDAKTGYRELVIRQNNAENNE